ncbi:MAG: glycoside hydrolase family 15 protein [Bacteriovoracia bacterium]
MYPYGLIGNCQIAALVSQTGSMEWLCLPRPDSPPVFGRLLDENGGHFSVYSPDVETSTQEYIRNTNVLVTTVRLKNGDSYRITDFCPRFMQFGRTFRPFGAFRILEPLSGHPTVQVECKPVSGWEKEAVVAARGSSHLRFDIRGDVLRLWTTMPMTYLAEGQSFSLMEKTYFGLTWNFALEDDLVQVTENFLHQTIDYWRIWVRHCNIPSEYQADTIRSALALKLHCYEDTGAILAALTTSLPEESGHTRNWDYRFCWLRDASFVLNAFHQLGHFEEMEGFLKFLLSVAKAHEDSTDRLRPVYALDRQVPLPEKEHDNWAGFGNSQPVRSKNQAAEHTQNDVYGEMLTAVAPIYFDERFYHLRTPEHEELIASLTRFCVKNISRPDAGLWEIRDGWQEHSFSNLLCWAGIERAFSIQKAGYLAELGLDLKAELARAEAALRKASVDGYVGNGPTDATPDASLLLMPLLRFPDVDLCRETVLRLERELTFQDPQTGEGFLYRYIRKDDFGRPASAFLICSYWLVQALVRVGEKERARKLMDKLLVAKNNLGLLAEHFDPSRKQQLGNFPQAYSHVGQILAAFAVSKPWEEVL